MDDAAFLQALEVGTLPNGDFGHAAHVRAGFLYLRRLGFEGPVARMPATIRNFARVQGHAELYHAVTIAFLALIAERLAARPEIDWPEFACRNPDLLRSAVLGRYFDKATLASDLARRVFLLPTRAA